MAAPNYQEMSIKDRLKECFMNRVIRQTKEIIGDEDARFALVCDENSVKLLSSIMTTPELTAAGVDLIQLISLPRARLLSHAVYLLTPNLDSMRTIRSDVSKKRYLFTEEQGGVGVFLYFTSFVDSEIQDFLVGTQLIEQLAVCEEVPLNFNCAEDYTFVCQSSPYSFQKIYDLPVTPIEEERPVLGGANITSETVTVPEPTKQEELFEISQQITAACAAIFGEHKNIHIQTVGENNAAEAFVEGYLRNYLNNYLQIPEDRSQITGKKCVVTIIDRDFDPVAPFMLSMGYQALAQEAMDIVNDKVTVTLNEDYSTRPSEWDSDKVAVWFENHKFGTLHKRFGEPNGEALFNLSEDQINAAFRSNPRDTNSPINTEERKRFKNAVEALDIANLQNFDAATLNEWLVLRGMNQMATTFEGRTGEFLVNFPLQQAPVGIKDELEYLQKREKSDETIRMLKVDEKDEFFAQWRYMSVIQASSDFQRIRESFDETPHARRKRGLELTRLEWRELSRNYQAMEKKQNMINCHAHMLFECLNHPCGITEQAIFIEFIKTQFTIATGYDPQYSRYKKPKDALLQMNNFFQTFSVSPENRTRMLMTIFAVHGWQTDANLRSILENAGCDASEYHVMKRLLNVGVDQNSSGGENHKHAEFHDARKGHTQEMCNSNNEFERYAPLIKYWLEREVVNQKANLQREERIDKIRLEYNNILRTDMTNPGDPAIRYENYKSNWEMFDEDVGEKTIKKSWKQLSSNNIITWQSFRDTMLAECEKYSKKHIPIPTVTSSIKKKVSRWTRASQSTAEDDDSEMPWLIFFLGGISYGEIRCIRNTIKDNKIQRDIYIGATEIYNGKEYVQKFTNQQASMI